ncbi:MAG: flagellar M-ring protein FliF C-terminal domain-containing protein [Phycisphaerales bacterium]
MEQIRRASANIQQSMGQLGPTQKLLFGSFAVIALMTLFLVSQYAGKPDMVDFMAQGSDSQLVGTLQAAGIKAVSENGRVMVPSGTERAALAHLGSEGLLPGDTTILFNNLISSQDWKASREQHRQQAVIALQNELSRVISQVRGIREATVIIDAPESSGLGRAVRQPSASVTVFSANGGAIRQQTVDAIASMVAGAKAGLDPSRVQVTDGTTGQPRQVSDEDQISSGRYMDHKKQVENYTRGEIERLLSYIPGVVVTVNALVDVTRVASTEQKYLNKDEGTVSLATKLNATEDTTTQASRGAEPGLRSSSTASISTGSTSQGAESSNTTEDSEFEVRVGSVTKTTQDPRGMPTHLSASVMVPQGYIEELIKASRPEDQADQPVTKGESDALFAEMSTMLETAILTRLETTDENGELRTGKVSLAMVPMAMGGIGGVSQVGGMGTLAGGSGGGGMFSASGMIETVLLGVLSVVAIGMMLMMVKRAGKRPELPSAEELVGVPPALEIGGDLVGEADESDSPMAGIEISEDEVKIEKMREQVAELIASSPDGAAQLVGRWIGDEE